MQTFLGDEKEEQRRLSSLRSIALAGAWGWLAGAVIGYLLGGYGGLLVGMFLGSVLFAMKAILGVKGRQWRHQESKPKGEIQDPAPETGESSPNKATTGQGAVLARKRVSRRGRRAQHVRNRGGGPAE